MKNFMSSYFFARLTKVKNATKGLEEYLAECMQQGRPKFFDRHFPADPSSLFINPEQARSLLFPLKPRMFHTLW